MPTEIYLMRHGETEFNVAKILQGQCDSPLTEEGKRQALAVGGKLAAAGVSFDAAFCSTLPRTAATARIILDAVGQPEMQPEALQGLCEYCFGSFERSGQRDLYDKVAQSRGLSTDDWLDVYRNCQERNLLIEAVVELDAAQQAETEAQFVGRLKQALLHIVATVPPNSRVLAVSHGMAITALLREIDRNAIERKSPPNVSVSRLHFDVVQGLSIVSVAEARFQAA